jgi:hypothetical protein
MCLALTRFALNDTNERFLVARSTRLHHPNITVPILQRQHQSLLDQKPK